MIGGNKYVVGGKLDVVSGRPRPNCSCGKW